MGSTGIDEEYVSSVSMRGVVSSTSTTNLHSHINGALAYNGVDVDVDNTTTYALAA